MHCKTWEDAQHQSWALFCVSCPSWMKEGQKRGWRKSSRGIKEGMGVFSGFYPLWLLPSLLRSLSSGSVPLGPLTGRTAAIKSWLFQVHGVWKGVIGVYDPREGGLHATERGGKGKCHVTRVLLCSLKKESGGKTHHLLPPACLDSASASFSERCLSHTWIQTVKHSEEHPTHKYTHIYLD